MNMPTELILPDVDVTYINALKPTLKRLELIESRMLMRGFQAKFNAIHKLMECPLAIIHQALQKSLDWAKGDDENTNHIESLMNDYASFLAWHQCFKPFVLHKDYWDKENNCSIITSTQKIEGETIPFLMSPTIENCQSVIETLELLGGNTDLTIMNEIDRIFDIMDAWIQAYFDLMRFAFFTSINVHFICDLGIDRNHDLIECLKKVNKNDADAEINIAIHNAYATISGFQPWVWNGSTSQSWRTLHCFLANKTVSNKLPELDFWDMFPIIPDYHTSTYKQEIYKWYLAESKQQRQYQQTH